MLGPKDAKPTVSAIAGRANEGPKETDGRESLPTSACKNIIIIYL